MNIIGASGHDIPNHQCPACGPFPLIDIKDLTARFLRAYQKGQLALPSPLPEGFNLVRHVVAPSVAHALQTQPPRFSSATMIRDSIPQFNSAGGGYVFGHYGQVGIPIYKCDGCRALYVLPADVLSAMRKAGPVNEGVSTVEVDILLKDRAFDAMKNAYQGLPIMSAQVYCFKEFVVMVGVPSSSIPAAREEKEPSLPVNDIAGLLAQIGAS